MSGLFQMSKREGVLSWDEYFMSLALLSSQRSKDPATQVGAVIVNKNKRIIGIGYNGFPHGCSDDDLPWGKSGQWEDTKYPFGKYRGDSMNLKFYVPPLGGRNCVISIEYRGVSFLVRKRLSHVITTAF